MLDELSTSLELLVSCVWTANNEWDVISLGGGVPEKGGHELTLVYIWNWKGL